MYKLKKIFKNEKGQGMVEYGLILATVSIVAVLGLSTLGGNIKDQLEGITDSMGGISEPGPGYSDEEIDDLITNHNFIPVATADELNNVRDDETNLFGKGTKWEGEYTGGLGKKYVQVKDIDLSEYSDEGWNPIGDRSSRFRGTYDGGNYVITGLEVKGEDKEFQGLFGYATSATISNVGLIDNTVTGGNHVGGLVGRASSISIENSYVTGSVDGKRYVGGLVGLAESDSIIENSYATGSVTGNYDVGGLVGWTQDVMLNNGGSYETFSPTIRNSYATGSVTAIPTDTWIYDGDNVGGLVGLANQKSIIENSHATGLVTGKDYAGGLVGRVNGNVEISISYATGSVTGGSYVGGLAGSAGSATIENTYATGSVDGSSNVGGLVGYVTDGNNTIKNSYAIGSVKGLGDYVGGLVGLAHNSYYGAPNVTISNSYTTGNVTGGGYVGGLVGNTDDTSMSKFDVINSHLKTTDEMKDKETYLDWDFDTVWEITPENYPTLR